MSDIAISMQGVKKSFGKQQVLKGVDFDIPKGTVFCLLGSNGAGKTTIVHVLTTLLKPDSGKAEICGLDVYKDPKEARKHFSLTGQYAAVDELLTARENLIMAGRLFHSSSPKQKADELLERFGLASDADKRVSRYSGGMRRRLDIAMSLAMDPEIIFLDEPTTGLDPQNRLEMWHIVRELSDSGITIFLTTQYLEEAERLADTIAILDGGLIVKMGAPGDLKALISGSSLIFSFDSLSDFSIAENRLAGYPYLADQARLSISVPTDGGMAIASELIMRLVDVNVVSMELKQASLEDVFLKLVAKSGGIS